ncbi:MAG TPA: glycosyltransferase family 2 protein [Burkholderiaceae bacterium]|jgi:glycosyltransferase involved in cell wall biosynthesis
MNNSLLSCVIPARNEARALPAVIEQVAQTLSAVGQRFEIVIVDDGSSDDTVAVMKALQSRQPVVLVELSRNFGKEAALMAGLAHARGDAIVMLDADGQHPVAMLPEMLQHWRQGAEQVVAVQSERVNTTLSYKLSVQLFYKLINRGARFELPAHAGDFRLLDRKVVDTLLALPERTRFMKGLYAWAGFRTVLLPYQPDPRIAGTSQFTSSSLRRLALDGLTSFSDLPLRAMSWLGFGFALFAVAMTVWFVVEYYVVGVDVPGWTTVVVLVSLLSGIQLVCLGILGAYVSRIFQESKQRPLYVVREVARPVDEL